MEKKRIFAALELSDEARADVASYISALQTEFRNVPIRWEKPEKLHITIKFVGGLDESELAAFTKNVAAAASNMTSIKIAVNNTGAFLKRSSRANVLWLGLTSNLPNGTNNMIESLAATIDHEAGIPSARRFKQHLTIARFKDAKKAHGLIERHLNTNFKSNSFETNQITIYESTLLPTGSVYRVLSRHNLAAKS
jgi:RNA 2',3'-cyclic 3'-phosphodiesterase